MAERYGRGPLERAADEVRSWFGDRGADRRREFDDRGHRRRLPSDSDRWSYGDYRFAGETILGRADWGDRESDYEHGFRPFKPDVSERDRSWSAERSDREFQRRSGFDESRPNFAGRGPRNYRRADDRIYEDVCEYLTREPYVDASDIEVRVSDGEVMLSGRVATREEKRRAEDAAAAVVGVKDVINHLNVSS